MREDHASGKSDPNPGLAKQRATSIAGADEYVNETDGLLALADDCDRTQAEARMRMAHIDEKLAPWAERARRNGIPEREIDHMADSVGPRLAKVREAGRL